MSGDDVYLWAGVETSSIDQFTIPKPDIFRSAISIKALSCGDNLSAFVTQDHRVYVMNWSYNQSLDSAAPRIVTSLRSQRVVSISCGHSHMACLTEAGEVYTLGANEHGQLGAGHNNPVENPAGSSSSVPNAGLGGVTHVDLPPCIWISCGAHHTCAITKTGVLYAWGDGQDGRLGTGDSQIQCKPLRVGGLLNDAQCISVAAGRRHTLVLDSAGKVYSFGSNDKGQLGRPTVLLNDPSPGLVVFPSNLLISSLAAADSSACLDDRGNLYMWGGIDRNRLYPRHCPSRRHRPYVRVSLSNKFACCLSDDLQVSLRSLNDTSSNGDDEYCLNLSCGMQQISVSSTRIMGLAGDEVHFDTTQMIQNSSSTTLITQNNNNNINTNNNSTNNNNNPSSYHYNPTNYNNNNNNNNNSNNNNFSHNNNFSTGANAVNLPSSSTQLGLNSINIHASSTPNIHGYQSPTRTRVDIRVQSPSNFNATTNSNNKELTRSILTKLDREEQLRVKIERELQQKTLELEQLKRDYEGKISSLEGTERRLVLQINQANRDLEEAKKDLVKGGKEKEDIDRTAELKVRQLQQRYNDEQSALQDQLAKAQRDRDEAKRELLESDAEKRQRNRELRELQNVKDELIALEEKLRNKTAEAERLRSDNAQLETMHEDSSNELRRNQRALEEAQKRVPDLEKELQQKESALKEINMELKAELDKSLSEWSKTRELMEKEHRAEIDKLNRLLRQERSDKEELSEKVRLNREFFDRQIADLQQKREDAEIQNVQIQRQLSDALEELEELKSTAKHRQDFTDSLRRQLEQEQLRTREAEDGTGEALKTVQQLTEQLRETQQRLSDVQSTLTSQLTNATGQIDELRAENSALKSRIQSRDDSLAKKDEKIGELGKVLSSLAEAYKTNERALEDIIAKNESLIKQVMNLEEKIKILAAESKYDMTPLAQEKIRILQQTLAQKEDIINNLHKQLQTERSNYDHARQVSKEELYNEKMINAQIEEILHKQAADVDHYRREIAESHITISVVNNNSQ